MEEKIKNAKIIDTKLGIEDHGIFTFTLFLNFGGYQQGIGPYCIDEYDPIKKTRVFNAKSMGIIAKILNVVGVDYWEDLPNNYIRVKITDNYEPGEIGHILADRWVNIRQFFIDEEGEKE